MNISVVIPAHNEARYIQQCLLALKRQSIQPYEVIVVDNNSSDDTVALAKHMGARVLYEPKPGIVFARNRGFSGARGSIIARIDADTVVPVNWIKQLQISFKNNQVQAITGPAIFYDVPLPRAFSFTYKSVVFGYNRLLLGHSILWGSNMALSKDMWRNVAAHTTSSTMVHEDLDLALVLNKQGYRVRYIPQLSVWASMRSLYRSPVYFRPYIKMWYATLRRHGYNTYGLDKAVGLLLQLSQPVVAKLCYAYLSIKFRWQHRWFESPDRPAQ